MEEMEVYVPTLGRSHSDTLVSLTRAAIYPTLVVSNYKDFSWYDKRILCPHQGIGPTRQWIIDQAKSNKVVMLDDDLVFAARRGDEPTKFREATTTDVWMLFSSIYANLSEFAHVGVSTREGGNRDTHLACYDTRLLRILAYRVDVLRREKIRFDRLELMEDFHVTLSLLSRGYRNIKINWIVHNQRSSNAPGGCSTYRTLEKQREAALGLKADFPDFVSVVEKTTKTAWQGKTRTDVVVQWKKALNASRKIVVLESSSQDLDLKESVLSPQEQSTKDTPDFAE